MHQRIIVRLELSPRARKWLQNTRETRGMTQIAMMSRLLEWYGKQPHMIRVLIMGQVKSIFVCKRSGLHLIPHAACAKTSRTFLPAA